jgi:hypothetical protein
MLASVDRDRPLFDDAGSDPIRALHLLGPEAAEPSSAIFEATRLRFITAMLDGCARAITEQNSIPSDPNHFV